MVILKTVMVPERLCLLTGDFYRALVLNKFCNYQRVANTASEYMRHSLAEETQGFEASWFYKGMEELCSDLLHPFGPKKAREIVSELVKLSYLETRFNPSRKLDRSLQYRVVFSNDLNNAWEVEGL